MITAQEASRQITSEIRKKNSKIVEPVPGAILKAGKPVRIFNVSEMRWQVPLGSLGEYTIHACEPGQRYSKPTEVRYIVPEAIPIDMERMTNQYYEGRTVAEDVVGIGPFKHPSQDLTRFGVFIAEGEVPTDAELEAARGRLQQHYIALVKEADAFYNEGPAQIVNITSQHRKAAEVLNVDPEEHPWFKSTKPMRECPVCGERVNPNAIIHAVPSCGAVLNEKEVIKRKLKGYESLWQKQA